MPEIWLNYGATEVVLEIMAENLEETINSGGSGSDNSMVSKVGSLGGESVMPPDTAGDDDDNDNDGNGGGGGNGGDNNDGNGGGGGDTAAEGGGDDGDVDGSDGDSTGRDDGDAGSGSGAPAESADGDAGTDASLGNGTGGPVGAGGSSIDGDNDNASDNDTGGKTYDDVSAATTTATATTAAAAGNIARARDHVPAPRQLEPGEISDILRDIDVTGPFDLVLLHDSQAVRQVVSSVFMMCEQRAVQFPGILADRDILPAIKPGLPEGSVAAEFPAGAIGGGRDYARSGDDDNMGGAADSNASGRKRSLIFVAEAEFDGLFGYETVSTRLLRRFDSDGMLAAYAKRDGNMPSPGRRTGSFAEAVKFADRFEIGGIDIVASSGGISDIFIGHPSETAARASASLESGFMLDVEQQRTLIASTGKASSNATLGDALSSVWNCHQAVRDRGLLVLVAECARGLGPAAIRMRVEGRLQPEDLSNPSTYVDGMEELLFLHEVQKRCQVALVSVLPEMYTKRLGLVSLGGMQESVAYLKKTQGARQRSSVVMDGSRLLLR